MKHISLILTVTIIICLSACGSSISNEAEAFLDDFETTSISDEYQEDGISYGVILSESEPVYYQYQITEESYNINVVDERSFSHYDTENDEDSYIEAKEIRHRFVYNLETKVLTKYDSIFTEISSSSILAMYNIDDVVEYIHIDLGYDSQLISFSEYYSVINELIRNGKENGTLNVIGNSDTVGLSFTISTSNFMIQTPLFVAHLNDIYDSVTVNEILSSISHSDYDDVHIKIRWDRELDWIEPNLEIYFRNIEYYNVTVSSSDFIDFQ